MSGLIGSDSLLLVGIGEVLWDLLPGGKALGGAPINVAAHAAQLGVRSAAVSVVGDDDDGKEIVERLRAMRVDVRGVRISRNLPTGAVDVALNPAGIPDFSIRVPAAWDAIEMDAALEQMAATADAIVFGSLAQRDLRSREGIGMFLRAAGPACLRVFDINLRHPFYTPEVVRSSLEVADVLKLNDAELPVLAGMLGMTGDETVLLHALRERFDLKLVVYTKGARGSRLISAREDQVHPGCRVAVVDTVGAGDAFTAAVVVGSLRGMRLDRIQDLASRIAAFVCSQPGAVPRLPMELTDGFGTGSL